MSSIDRFENRSKEMTDRCSRSRRTRQTFTSLNISPRRLWNFEHTRGWVEALFDSLPKLALPLISSRVTQPACILSIVLAMLGSRGKRKWTFIFFPLFETCRRINRVSRRRGIITRGINRAASWSGDIFEFLIEFQSDWIFLKLRESLQGRKIARGRNCVFVTDWWTLIGEGV